MRFNPAILVLFIFSTFFCFSQGRNDNWNFGRNASVSFPLGGAPVATTNSAFATEEGSSSISDANGTLLFYSDGGNVYDATNNLMPNGNNIQGYIYQGSSTQSCIIIKKPGSTTLFYIFTVAESSNNPNPFSYSIVDMSLNAGLGDVVIASKNTLIFNGTSEKIAATYHCNGTDIWIATHDINSSNYRTVLLSAAGVGAPVLSSIGPIVTNIGGAAGDQGVGSMKFSHDGDKLAMCNIINSDILDILDFNKTTGVFSNRLNIFNVADAGKLYGLEFSPNNQILYVANGDNVIQYNISSGVAATIAASRLIVGAPFDNDLAQLQLAPNGKIYCAQTRTQPLGIINSPNTVGVGCNWDLIGFDVDPGLLGNEVRTGLPSLLHFIPTKFIYPGGSSTSATYCQGDPSAPTPSLVFSYPTVGSYSTSAGGLSINPATGALNLGLSTPNTYTVTFTAAVTAGCTSPFFSTYTIIITPGVALCYTKRAARWDFGSRISLNFLCSSPPSHSDDSQVNTPAMESGCSMADVNGNLLFYAFANRIRNNAHQIMPNGNGLLSDVSASQGFLAIPNPTNTNRYYLFAIGSGAGGLSYSEVDMLLDGGKGDIIVATKNTLLQANVREQMTAVENCDGTGTWLIVHTSLQMFAYLVTASGIAAPVISNVPLVAIKGGQLMASPTGRHIAYAADNDLCELYTFDNETGKVCHKETMVTRGYGCSFSNNGQYLYTNGNFTGIYQLDVLAANIAASAVQIYDPFVSGIFIYGQMQLAPDCKLYVFGLNSSLGSYIEFPNNPGLTCNLQANSFSITDSSFMTQYGIPQFIQSWFKDPTYVEPVIAANFTFSPTTVCLPSPITFSNSSTTIGDCPPYLWNFGDAASGASNTSTLTSPSHIFSSPGTYSVTLTLTERCQTSIKIILITVYGAPIVTIIADTTVCENFGVTLNTSSIGTYLWTGPSGNLSGVFTSTLQNPTNPVFLGDGFANEGWYYLTVTNGGGCSATDSIYIHILAVPSPNVTSSIVNCIQTLTGAVTSSNGPITSYAWGPGGGSSLGTTSVINLPVGYPGPQVIFFVVDSEGCGAGFILLTPPLVPPTVTAGATLALTCTTLSGIITASSTTPGATYSWTGAGVTAGGTTSSATVNVAGTYTVTVTNPSNGCTVSATVAVTASATLPTAIIIADTTVCDHDLVTLSTPSIGTYLWTGPGFGSGFSSTLQNPTNPPHLGLNFFNEGWYYLTVTNSSGCSTTDSVYISILTPPDPYFLDSIANCQHIFTVGVFSSNGPIISYVWGPIVLGTDSVVTVPFGYSGAINCFLLDSEGCGQGIISSTTNLAPPTTPIIYTPNSWYCVGDNTTPLNSSSGDLWYSNPGLTTLVGTGLNFSPPTITGIATYYVVDTSGTCISAAASVTVEFTNCAAPACATNLLSNGGFDNYSTCPTNTQQVANATSWLGSGDYYNTICNGYYNSPVYFPYFNAANYTLGLAGGGVFPPPVGAGSAGLILGGTIFKSFIAQQINLGCSKEYTLQFRATAPRSDTPPDNSLCVYGSNTPPPYSGCSASLTLLACLPSPASINNYWTPQTITFTPTVNYSYMVLTGQCPTSTVHGGTVFIDDLFLCSTCTNPPVVNASEITPASCIAADGVGNASVIGCDGTYTYDWQNVIALGTTVSTLSTPNNLAAGGYSVIVTDGGGCTGTSSVTITSSTTLPTVSAISSNNITCTNLNSTLTGTSTGNTMVWNGGALPANSPNPIVVSTAGTYTVTSTDAISGCINTETVIVTSNTTAPTVTAGLPLVLTCTTLSGNITASSLTPGATFNWTGAGITAGAATSIATVNAANTYTVTVTDSANGCTATTTVVVTANTTLPAINISGSLSICNGANTTLTASGATNYLWMPSAVATNTITVSPTSTITYTVIGTMGGCTDSTQVTVTVNQIPTTPIISASGPVIFCQGTSVVLTAIPSTGIVWSNSATTTSIVVNTAGSYTAYSIAAGCTSIVSSVIVVSVNPEPTAQINSSPSAVACAGQTITLTSQSATGNAWSTGPTSTNIQVTTAGTYTLILTDANGCDDTTQVTVSFLAPIVATIAGNDTVCFGLNITLTASGAGSFLWNNNSTNQSIIVSPNTNTTYSVIVSNGSCSDTATLIVNVVPSPTVIASANPYTINYGAASQLSATTSNFYSWSPATNLSCNACQNPSASPTVTTIYTVTVTNAQGCTNTDTVMVVVDLNCQVLFLPTAFSPNGDLENDSWCIYGTNCVSSFAISVFDRWGKLVYNSEDISECWNGLIDEKETNNATFFYKMDAVLVTGEVILRNGNVTIVK